jgi:two-component system, NtrC family, nitrogen regulation sensor histidine kinase GlnL
VAQQRGELVIISGRYRGHRIPLSRDIVRVGRDRNCDFSIDDEAASRVHLEIVKRDNQLVIRDLRSTNGTFVNDARVSEEWPLQNGDRIAVGDTMMLLQITPQTEALTPNIVFSKDNKGPSTRYSLSLTDTRFLQLKDGTALGEAQRHLGLLYEFMNELAGILHLPALMDRALNLFLKAFPADRALILLLTPDGEPGMKVTKFRDNLTGNRDITISRTMAHQLLQKKESFLSVDAHNDERLAASQSLHDMRVYSIMGVPLMVKDKVIGMLYFDTMGSGQVFSETDLKLCSAMGLQLAVYSENTRLYTELLDATEFSQSVLRSLKSGVVVMDLTGRVIRANKATEEILGIQEIHILGHVLSEYPEFVELHQVIQNTLATGVPEDRYEVLVKVNGSVIPLGLTTSLLTDHTGKIIGVVANFRNLAQIRKLEEQLRRSQHLAALGQIAAGVAHEIRNPLNSIRGFAQLLQELVDKSGQPAEYTQIILEEVDRMNRIVQDLLDYSRQRELTLAPVPMDKLVDELVRDMQPEAKSANVLLNVARTDVIVPNVMGNSDKLRQVLRNIVLNAVQACGKDGGRVTLSLSLREERAIDSKNQNIADAPVRRMVAVAVEDTGGGIDPAIMAKIFDPFFTQKDSGTGLGLSISQKIIDQHGGRIEVKSELGKGSTFTILAPGL